MTTQMTRVTSRAEAESAEGTLGVAADRMEVADAAVGAEGAEALVEEDLLVEEVSIDGMCGVY